ncbi:MAG TPA: C25 family cysteine peptidase [Blastocatellia bacterium]|nr:C25 family cysteine peptidase [Blastocatellia bacterium]
MATGASLAKLNTAGVALSANDAEPEFQTAGNNLATRLTMGDSGSSDQARSTTFRSIAQGTNAQTGDVERAHSRPQEDHLRRGRSFDGDIRTLPRTRPVKFERPEHDEPNIVPRTLPGTPEITAGQQSAGPDKVVTPSAAAPAPTNSFDGLDFANWGAGHPPDTNGDVGPTYFIQTINTSVGIFRKSDNVRVAAFTFNALMSQGNFGNLCDTDNFGDPVVLYDTFEDRWVITDFAFKLSGGNVVSPADQCFAVSKNGDPVNGGWNFYSRTITDALDDYPKFGVWTDGIYMSANMFTFGAGSVFVSPRAFAFNKAQMYAGAPTVQVVSFDGPAADFTVIPSNARLQTGTPPPGTPNFYISTSQFLNAVGVYKFHVDWNRISLSTFTGPDTPIAATSWPNSAAPNAPSSGGNSLDVLATRAMMQNQYSNFGGVESLWVAHTVRRQNTSGFAAPRFYQANVTGGTVAPNLVQAMTWDPDGANVMFRFLPSLDVDRAGDLAMGYSTSSSTTKPAIKYAGRLAGDPVNTFSQGEQLLIQGTGTQTGSCGTGSCIRWGDYSAMTLDVDGCTFWYTNEYYATDGLSFLTRIGTFTYPSCTPQVSGTISGTVTATGGGSPISGATVSLGSRTTTTAPDGTYSFTSLPSGTYPTIAASKAGFNSSSVNSIVLTDGGTTTQNFSLSTASSSGCFTDTTQSDFQTGVAVNCDLTSSPGDITLSNAPASDQSNTAGTTTGTGFGTPAWTGQTFIPAVTGNLVKADVQLFCNGCGATPPNLTLSVRATSGGLPTGADLASTTILGSSFASGATATVTSSFGSPATLTAGTQYALILRPVSAPAGSGYFWIRSSPSTYANGSRVLSADSGATWSADTTRDFNFRTYMQTGFSPSGTFTSSVKDANPATNFNATWTTISWTADTPSGTSINFQVAASNNPNGPFNFVGPDGTAGTFFSNGGSLSRFNGFRYLQYQATFTTNSGATTPTLHDVTVCFNDTANTSFSDPGGTCGGNTPCFTTITAAINAVPAGGIVNVGAGSYNEAVTLNTNVTLNFTGNVTINGLSFSTGTVNCGTGTVHIDGNFSNSGGTFNGQTCTIQMDGSAGPLAPGGGGTTSSFKPKVNPPSSITGTNTFFNLDINDPNGVIFVGGSQTVTGTLTLTQGILNTNSNTLIMSSTGGINQIADFILGTVTKQAISGSFTFPMGDNHGSTPLAVANAGGGGDFTVTTTSGTAPTLNASTTLGEFWTLSKTGSVTLDMTFNYLPADVHGDESQYFIIRVDSGIAVTFGNGVPGVSYDRVNHTATITGVSQFSDWTLGQSVSPTAVNLDSFTATAGAGGTALEWRTGFEVNSLGFNIYRQVNGQRVQVNPSLIAGSALMVGSDVRLQSGYTYNWTDDVADRTASYWIEDIDLNGTSTWHGPFGVTSSNSSTGGRISRTRSPLLNSVTRSVTTQKAFVSQRGYPAGLGGSPNFYGTVLPQTSGRSPQRSTSVSTALKNQWSLANKAALKIAINKTGWYRISGADLVAAGLNSGVNPQNLQMFVGGTEIPIEVNQTTAGPLGPNDSIEFFGTGLNTPSSDTQIYWLVEGAGNGKRINTSQTLSAANNTASSFAYTVERKDRMTYMAGLLNGDAENWFGGAVTAQPFTESVTLNHLDNNSNDQSNIEIALQGVTNSAHQVNVMLNGTSIGAITFDGQSHFVTDISVPQSTLAEGGNSLTFVAQGSGDVSLVDYVRVTYAHTYVADGNSIFATQTGMQPVRVTGFTSNQIRAIDVTNPSLPVELQSTVENDGGNYSISFTGGKNRNLLVFTPDQASQPLSMTANQPSNLNSDGTGGNLVIITYKDFAASLQPLVALKQSQGYKVKLVDVEDIYDEFSYGVHTPYAIKDFLSWANLHWPAQPQYVLMAGSGTLDPRNYTGAGNLDFVPIKLIDTSSMETASDDWFVDFKNSGQPQLAIGRLPIRTGSDGTSVVNKIIAYEQSGTSPQAVVLVSDLDENGINFSLHNSQIKSIVSSLINTVDIFRQQSDAKTQLVAQLMLGQRVFNYAGHGSVNLWRGNLLTDDDVQALSTGKASPLIVSMTCLNGYFQDPRLASLGEELLKVNQGGAVSIWASSGMTDPGNQSTMNQEFFKQLFGNFDITIGDAIKKAKASEMDSDIRRTWIFFGDPTMKLKH